MTQTAKNLVMDLEDADCRARHLIRGGKFPDLFDAVLQDAGIEVVLSGVRIPRMNSITERWLQTCRRELLDRTLIWDRRHLMHGVFQDLADHGFGNVRCAGARLRVSSRCRA